MGIYNTNKSHLSSTHNDYTNWSPEYFKNKAARHGENVVACIKGLFIDCDYPETAYKRAMGIIQLHRQYGSGRLDNACKRAVYADAVSYTRIKNILQKNLDKEPLEDQLLHDTQSHIPIHQNIRGAKAYR
jgi:hypothetical protein